MRRALLPAVAALALLPGAAGAHAVVEATTPARGAALERQPAAVSIRFDEPVEAAFGAVRVFASDGRRVDDGKVSRPAGDAKRVAIGLRPGLADGGYTATYRVVSADGHPVTGGFAFQVGDAPASAGASVEDLLAGSSTGRATEIGFGATRALGYAAMAVALGLLVFAWLCWPRGLAALGGDERRGAAARFAARWRVVWWAAAGTGVVTTLLGIVFQAATAGGTSLWSALEPSVLEEVLHTQAGRGWLVRLLAWALLAGAVALVARRERGAGGARRLDRAVPAFALLLAVTPALGGHAAVQRPVWLLFPLDTLHVAAASTWLGGLMALAVVVPRATRALEPPDRTRVLAGALVRFSAVALAAAVALTLTGVGQAIIHVERLGALTDTAFGRAVLVKVGLLLLLVALGAVNRRRSVPRLRAAAAGGEAPGAAGRLLRTTLRAEVALALTVLGVTGALVSYPPPSSLAGGPVSRETGLGTNRLQLTVDPAQPGANEVHLYVFAPDGAPFTGSKELRATASLPDEDVGPLTLDARRAGPGHYVIPGAPLSPGGDWRLTIRDRVSEFDEYSAEVEVPVG